MPLRVGADLVAEAHDVYELFTPDGRLRAAPLIRTMYRLANIEVAGQTGIRRVRAKMLTGGMVPFRSRAAYISVR